MSAQGTLRFRSSRKDPNVGRWTLYFRVAGKDDESFPSDYTKRSDEPAAERWADEVRAQLAKLRKAPAAEETVSQWWTRYLAWRPRRESIEDSVRIFAKWIGPAFGHLPIVDVTPDHIEAFAEMLDEKTDEGVILGGTATKIFGEVVTALNVASGDSPTRKKDGLRVLTINPCKGVAGPEKRKTRSKPILRPAEIHALLECPDVPLYYRQIYAVAIYTAMRQGELRALRPQDVDLTAMQISVTRQTTRGKTKDRTKTDTDRVVTIEPNLVPLLRVLTEGRPADGLLLPKMPKGTSLLAASLRSHLLRAGVTRDALHVARTDPNRLRLRFHHLRDTCGSHMAVRGDQPYAVQWRLGHSSPKMTEIYIRRARYEAGPAFGEPLAPLPSCLIGVVTHVVTCDAAELANAQKTEAAATMSREPHPAVSEASEAGKTGTSSIGASQAPAPPMSLGASQSIPDELRHILEAYRRAGLDGVRDVVNDKPAPVLSIAGRVRRRR